MLRNANTTVRELFHAQDPGTFKVLFKYEAIRLSKILDGPRQHLYPRGSNIRFQTRRSRTIVGWEYSDVVENCTEYTPKSVRLGKDCGDWHRYARDFRVIPFFCSKVGDAETITPKDLESVCPVFRTLPEGRSHLPIRVPALPHKYERQGCHGSQLTPSGYTLLGPDDAFQPCHCKTGTGRASVSSGGVRPNRPTSQEGPEIHCKCIRTYRIERKGKAKRCSHLSCFEGMGSGAIIVGTYDATAAPTIASMPVRLPPMDSVGARAPSLNEKIQNTVSIQVPNLFGSIRPEQTIQAPTADQLDTDEDDQLSDWSSSSVEGGVPLDSTYSEGSEEDGEDDDSSTEMDNLKPMSHLIETTPLLAADDVEDGGNSLAVSDTLFPAR